MPIKHQEFICRNDFDEAVVRLRLNVSDVAKETGIPRTYLSEFRNGDRRLKPELQAKLRDFFEQRGIEFEPEAQTDAAPVGPVADSAPIAAPAYLVPHPRLAGAQTLRCYFPIADDVPDVVVVKAMDMMEEADARLTVLFKTGVEHDDGIFGDGEWSEAFKAALQEAFALCASNYVLFRMLRGWRAFGVSPIDGDPVTLRDVFFDTFRSQFAAAGLIADGQTEPVADREELDSKYEEEDA